MERAYKILAEELIQEYGDDATEDALRISEWLHDRGLDHCQTKIDEMVKYMEWLVKE